MHDRGSTTPMYRRVPCDSFAMPTYSHIPIGEIPQVRQTYQYINTAYPSMNQYQLGIGESHLRGKGGAAIRLRTHRLSEALSPDAGTLQNSP
jgi:hypothetical protein